MKIREILSENESSKVYSVTLPGYGDDAYFTVTKEGDNIFLDGFDLDVPFRREDTGAVVRSGYFDFVYQIQGEDEGLIEIHAHIPAGSQGLEYDDDAAGDAISDASYEFKEKYGTDWHSIVAKVNPEEGGLEVEEDQSSWDLWLQDKIKLQLPSNGEVYVSAKDNHLILHGVEVPTYAWTDRDGDGHEGEFDFDYDLMAEKVINVDYPDRSDSGYYIYDDESFYDDIDEVVQEFNQVYGDKVNALLTRLTPEEGGLEVEESTKYPFAGAAVGHKAGVAGQWRNKGPKKNKPAKPGDLVGGGM